MSRGGSAPGWGWGPPSRRRRQQEQQRRQQEQQLQQQQQLLLYGRRRRSAAEGGRAWVLPAVGLVVAASMLVLLLGLSGAALSGAAAAAGGAWAVAAARKDRRKLPARPALTVACYKAPSSASCYKAGRALANGEPAMSCSPPERRRLYGDHLTPPTHFALHRRYPIRNPQYNSLGTLPSLCWDGYRQKPILSIRNTSMFPSPVRVRIAPPDSKIDRLPKLEQLAPTLALPPTPSSTPDPCATETVLSALKASRKRNVEDGDQSSQSGQDSKRRRHDSSGSGQSAFEPVVANGAPASLVPKPGSLKRNLAPPSLDNGSSKRSRTSSLSSADLTYVAGITSSSRNAIASSYSSTRGLPKRWKRSGPSTSPLSSPVSSGSQTPEKSNKKVKYPDTSLTEAESQQSSTSTPVKADTEKPAEKNAETPVQNSQSSLSLQSSSSSGSGTRKRRIQLLTVPSGEKLILPPPIEVGYPVTSADFDAEKEAALQRLNKLFEDKTDATPSTSVEVASPPSTLASLMPAQPASVPLMGVATGTNPQSESLKNVQEGQSGAAQADSAPATQTPETTAAAISLDLGSPASVTTSEAKPSLPLSVPGSLAPPSSTAVQPASSESSLVTSSSQLGQTPSRPSSAPKPSILFGMLTSPPASQPTAAAAAAAAAVSSVSSPASVFKPVFGSITKMESPGFSAGSASLAGTTSPGTVPSSAPTSATPSSSSPMFKPIFGSVPPLATATPPATTASFFAFKNSTQPALATGLSATSSSTSSGFPDLSQSIATTAMSPSTAMNMTSISTSAPVFSFSLGMPASTSAPSTTAAITAASSQSFPFGVSPSGAAAPKGATTLLFRFGKPATTAAPGNALASSTFSQTSASTAQSVPSSTTVGFSIFGSGGSSTATAPAASTAPPSTQPTLFGSGPSAFSGAFGAPSKPPPPYTGDASQLAFVPSVPDGQQQQQLTTKPTPGPVSFGSPFNFPGSVAQPAAQPAFGSTTQTTFGGTGPLASFGAKSTPQPAFGATASIFSFGTATTSTVSGFGSNTQTTSNSTGGSVFGSSTPSPFAFGASAAPSAVGSTFALGAPAAAGSSAPMGGFSFGGQSGTVGAATPFASSLAQNPMAAQNQNTAFAFSIPGTSESKPAFGVTPTPTFGQSSPVPRGTTGSSNLSFGTPITPAFGGAGPPFGPSAPAFSIGAGSKTLSRQRWQGRRPRKK